MMVITPKQVGAVLMSILKLFLGQFSCASVGKQTNFDIKHGVNYLTNFSYMRVTPYDMTNNLWPEMWQQ
jgi:hypothetical protein